MKALYVKGFVDGKPMSKMLVDGGASVNLMPYTTFCKLGKGSGDLIKTDMMLKDFGGNASKIRGAMNVELTIRSKTLLTTFFVIDGKGSYSLLIGRDWIHENYCVPSTMILLIDFPSTKPFTYKAFKCRCLTGLSNAISSYSDSLKSE